jgi:hypothetical protein
LIKKQHVEFLFKKQIKFRAVEGMEELAGAGLARAAVEDGATQVDVTQAEDDGENGDDWLDFAVGMGEGTTGALATRKRKRTARPPVMSFEGRGVICIPPSANWWSAHFIGETQQFGLLARGT